MNPQHAFRIWPMIDEGPIAPPFWCDLVQNGVEYFFMAIARKARPVRRSVSLRPDINSKVRDLARHEKRSSSRVLENLIEIGLQTKEAEKRHFFDLADHLRATDDPAEIRRIKGELARMTFGS